MVEEGLGDVVEFEVTVFGPWRSFLVDALVAQLLEGGAEEGVPVDEDDVEREKEVVGVGGVCSTDEFGVGDEPNLLGREVLQVILDGPVALLLLREELQFLLLLQRVVTVVDGVLGVLGELRVSDVCY